ncbi:MAG: helix-turn-helix domain-containing protein [Gemmiger sp.]
MDALFHGESPRDPQGGTVRSDRIIYTPSNFAKTNLLYLQETGQLQARRPHTSRRSNLQSCLFFVVLQGAGTLTFGGAEYPLAAGDCVFVDCMKGYSHRSSDELWTLRWAHFYGPNLPGIYGKYVERGGEPVFRPAQLGPLCTVLDELYTRAASQDYIGDMRICEKLTTLLTLLMAETTHPDPGAPSGGKRRSIREVKDYLDTHYAEHITLDGLAAQFFINKFYLARRFKEQFGVPVGTYLAQVRVTHAKQLLRFTDLTVEQVGAACGVEEPSYFARLFKKVEGIAPGEYRRMW